MITYLTVPVLGRDQCLRVAEVDVGAVLEIEDQRYVICSEPLQAVPMVEDQDEAERLARLRHQFERRVVESALRGDGQVPGRRKVRETLLCTDSEARWLLQELRESGRAFHGLDNRTHLT